MEKTANGAGFLKVTGILMIIGGVLGCILAIITLAGLSALEQASYGLLNMGMLRTAGILTLIGGVVELIAGIVGLKNCKAPEKAGTCLIWGILTVVISVASNIITSVGGGSFNIVLLLLGLILPALYIIGACKNRNR